MIGFVDDARTGVAVDIAEVLTTLGSLPVVGSLVLMAMALLAWRRRPYELFTLLVGTAIVYAGVHMVKDASDRPRPEGALTEADGSAFPSGHAAYSGIYVALGVIAARVMPGAVSQAALMVGTVGGAAVIGATRAYLGVHYYSDVVAGWALTALVFGTCAIVALVVSYLRENEGRREPRADRPPLAAPEHG